MTGRTKAGQKGFTLIELLVAIPIAALVMLAASGAIVQLIHSSRASAQMNAIRQVQMAGTWISRDGLQAQTVIIDPDPATDNLCTFVWHDDTVTPHKDIVVFYEVKAMSSGSLSELQRQVNVKIEGASTTTTTTTIVARNLVSAALDDMGTSFKLEVASTVGQKTVTRTYEVTPRPAGNSGT